MMKLQPNREGEKERKKIFQIIFLIIRIRFLDLFLSATAIIFPRPLRFQRALCFDRLLQTFLCLAHICLERVAFRCNTFISILQQSEADSLVACATVANECVRVASENGSRKKLSLKTRIKFPRHSLCFC